MARGLWYCSGILLLYNTQKGKYSKQKQTQRAVSVTVTFFITVYSTPSCGVLYQTEREWELTKSGCVLVWRRGERLFVVWSYYESTNQQPVQSSWWKFSTESEKNFREGEKRKKKQKKGINQDILTAKREMSWVFKRMKAFEGTKVVFWRVYLLIFDVKKV